RSVHREQVGTASDGNNGGSVPPPPAYGQPYGAPAPAASNQKALWAMISGIVGLLCCGPLGIVALILGNQAKKEIAATGGVQGGLGMAKAGVILGIIALVLWAILLVLRLTGAINAGMSSV
ncbi:MAG TPA: DUF4190 domain-containing protein, partial [Marmoricola sp.]|nr:DUF4190 domain-containing protein [Marmoricola sp.]